MWEWLKSYWWRFFIPLSTKWSYNTGTKVTHYSVYIFGVRITRIQTNDPSRGR